MTEQAQIVLDWPDALHIWLEKHRLSNSKRTGIHADHGNILDKIKRGWHPDNPAVNEVRRYLRQSPLVVKPWSYFYTEEESERMLSGVQAAARLGVRKNGLQRLATQGHLDVEFRKAGGVVMLYVSRESVEKLLDLHSGSLSYGELATELGLSRYQVIELYNEGIFEPLPRIGKRDWPRFSADTPSIFEGNLRNISIDNLKAERLLSLAEVPRLHQERFLDVIGKVLLGDIACQIRDGKQPLFRRVMVDERSLRDDGLGVHAAAAMLGIHERMIPHLIAAGCLQVDQRWDRRYRSLSKTNVDAFRRDYQIPAQVTFATYGSRRSSQKPR
jgi:hypothetical protein